MIVRKNLSLKSVYEFTGHYVLWLTLWMLIATVAYNTVLYKLFTIPWLPISLIGTAVAFYVGFKNSQSYQRLLEARQVWGGIVNNSRKLGTMLKHFSSAAPIESGEDIRRLIIFQHIDYVYQVRSQLLEPMPWEHVSLKDVFRSGIRNRRRRDKTLGLFRAELTEIERKKYVPDSENNVQYSNDNRALQMLDEHTKLVQKLHHEGHIDSIQQMQLQTLINNICDEQGRLERIKKFPFPRKYASFSFIFVGLFIFLLPFGLAAEVTELGSNFIWLTVPIGVVVGWVYIVMEMIGDYSENPFQGLHNDIPMLSLCRGIEIDLLQMINEKNVPKPISAKNGVLL